MKFAVYWALKSIAMLLWTPVWLIGIVLAVPVMLWSWLADAYDKLELDVRYKGDEAARQRDRWKRDL